MQKIFIKVARMNAEILAEILPFFGFGGGGVLLGMLSGLSALSVVGFPSIIFSPRFRGLFSRFLTITKAYQIPPHEGDY
jgi:hypothetical protein